MEGSEEPFFYHGLVHADNNSALQGGICGNDSLLLRTGECMPIVPTNDSCSGNGTLSGSNPYIMPWYLQAFYCLVFVSMVLVGALGNLTVIWIVLAHKRMRTVTNYFLVNLAIADALISIANTLFNFAYMLYSDWPFGRAYCKFIQFIAPCTICASVFTFMAIAIDRYMAIVHPLRPRMKARKVLGVITVIWLISFAISFPCFYYAQTHTWVYCSGNTRTVCYLQWPDGSQGPTDFWYNIFLMLANYVIPLVALGVTYARVGCELWGSQAIGERTKRQEETIKSKRKVVKMMIIVVVIFAVCWLPQHVYFLVANKYPINQLPYIQHVYLAIYWLAMSNSMYNPLIYCWMNQRFRMGFKYVFRWLPCVKWEPAERLPTAKSGVTARSLSETTMSTKYERNGSTMMDSLGEDASYAPSAGMYGSGSHRPPSYHIIRMRDHDYKRQAEDAL